MVAEKFQAMVYLRTLNSRMKDFYEVWLLARRLSLSANADMLAAPRGADGGRTQRECECGPLLVGCCGRRALCRREDVVSERLTTWADWRNQDSKRWSAGAARCAARPWRSERSSIAACC